ncbi:MAG: redoxin domain-containing protein [Solirubrobacterales bacterium]|nr:redoxin domain-containing protein [Solirubrobacterales bacterium]
MQYAHEAFSSIAVLAKRWPLVIFFYPGSQETASPGERGAVSPDERRAVAWMRCEAELATMGYELIGVSAQSPIEQARFASRDPLPYMLFSDPKLKLAELLGLPTSGAGHERVYDPLTLVVRKEQIARVFHPVHPVNERSQVMSWIRNVESQ